MRWGVKSERKLLFRIRYWNKLRWLRSNGWWVQFVEVQRGTNVGSHVFEEGKQCSDRRMHRTARRRLDRRQQRVHLTQEIFAKAISEVDERFFIRLKESALFREDTSGRDTYLFFKMKIIRIKSITKTIQQFIISLKN